MAGRETREAFVTLATNDTYALGCLVLGSSLRRVGTTRQLAVMVTTGVSQSIRDQLSRIYNLIFDVDLLDSRDPTNLQLLGRPDLNVTFTKFHCWKMTMYDKAVFLDADTLVLQNVDELFDREELSAAPDAGWPDCFNSGVFVFRPSDKTYNDILQFALDQGSFDGGDQGLLNMFFRGWATEDISRHLPFIYNVVSQAFYSYLPAFKQFKDNVKIVHFIGATKPWHQPYNTSTGQVTPLEGTQHNQQFLQRWWTIFMSDVQPLLDPHLMSMIKTTRQKSHDVELPKPILQSAFPYVPPQVDNVFYDAKPVLNSEDKDTTNNKSLLMDIPRLYTELEGHYAEEPMTSLDQNSSSSHIYDAPKVVQTWNSNMDQNRQEEEQKSINDSSHDSDNSYDNHNFSEIEHDKTIEENDKEPCIENNNDDKIFEESESDKLENNENAQDLTGEEGLIGQLATLRVSGNYEAGPQLSSEERKLNWEKGQIDYLGADAFDNIQKKLEESITKPAEPHKPPTSPFPMPSSEPTEQTKESKEVVSISSSVTETEVSKPVEQPIEPAKSTSTAVAVIQKPAPVSKAAPEPAPKPTTPTSPGVPKVAPKPSTPPGNGQTKELGKPEPAPKTGIPSKPTPIPPAKPAAKPEPAAPKPDVVSKTAPGAVPKTAQEAPKAEPAAPKPGAASKFGMGATPKTTEQAAPKPGIASKFGGKLATQAPAGAAQKDSPASPLKPGPPTFPKPSTPTSAGPTGVASKFGSRVGSSPATPTSPPATSPTAQASSTASKPSPGPKKVTNPFASRFGK